jgi:ferric-dicitrate binding protein FerR (iron transport regulator)
MKQSWRVDSRNRDRFPHLSCMMLQSANKLFLFFVAFVLMSLIVPVPLLHAAARERALPVFASSVVGRQVELNGSPMQAGATLFAGDVLRLGENSTAALQFGNSSVLAAPLTELVVESQSLKLRSGHLQVRVNGKGPFAVAGPFFQLNVAGAEGITGAAEIKLGGARAEVSAVAGTSEITSAGSAPYKLQPGETAMLEAGSEASAADTAATEAAGKVSRLIPQVQIDRASQHIVAQVSSGLYWNDELRSGPGGRAHVTLKDGSQLNLGSDSSLRILQHDAQAQQTSLDLLVGRVRGKITKLSKANGKFEIHTPMGIAGLVGTDLSLAVTNEYTELMVFEGSVRFTTLSGQAIIVPAGKMIRISKAGTVDGPSDFPPQDALSARSLTDINGATNSGPAGAAARPAAPLIITLTGVGVGVGLGVWQGTRSPVSVSLP